MLTGRLVLRLTVFIICYVVASLSLAIVFSNWHLSHDSLLSSHHLNEMYAIVRGTLGNISPFALPHIPDITIKDRLGAWDALVNVATLLVLLFASIAVLFLGWVVAFVLIFVSVYQGDWGNFLASLFAFVLFPILGPIIFIIIILISAFLLIFFETSTPGYVVTWLLVGVPLIFLSVVIIWTIVMVAISPFRREV